MIGPGERDVDVWTAHIDLPPARVAALARLLSADERERAASFRGAELRARFIAARGQLREVLANYLGSPPEGIRFAYERDGKPALEPDGGSPPLHFNLSHSGSVAAFAVTRAGRVGIDVEQVRLLPDLEAIARRFFAEGERRALARVAPEEYPLAFYCCWTRKEAYLKATGSGLLAPLDGFEVTVDPAQPARLLQVRGDPQAAGRWALRHFVPVEGYVGAVAAEKREVAVRVRRWEGADGP